MRLWALPKILAQVKSLLDEAKTDQKAPGPKRARIACTTRLLHGRLKYSKKCEIQDC